MIVFHGHQNTHTPCSCDICDGEWVAPKTALPHLPRGFGRELQVYGVEVGFYPEIPRLPQIEKSFMVYRNEAVAPKTALPHLPKGFGCELQVNGVEVGFYPKIPRLPQIAK